MEMLQMVKDFFKNGKKYLDYIMGLDFTELMINILEIIGLVILAALVYLPIGLVQDLIYEIVRSAFGASEVVFKWYTVLFRFFTGVVAIIVFMYLFNRRYSKLDELIEKDIMRNRKAKEKKEHKENEGNNEEKKEEIDLPKKKD
jgi:hypothetical protein